ncbi:hypothetical protein [Streptomyces sp. NPDC046870]|uniref:hypothetical protein n=1 Tax=Streptomyces sp. NPDC046870 TaxID=3155135 RepID=UPI0034540495
MSAVHDREAGVDEEQDQNGHVAAVPAAAAGALLFSTGPLPAPTRLIGVFLLITVI